MAPDQGFKAASIAVRNMMMTMMMVMALLMGHVESSEMHSLFNKRCSPWNIEMGQVMNQTTTPQGINQQLQHPTLQWDRMIKLGVSLVPQDDNEYIVTKIRMRSQFGDPMASQY